MELQVTNNFSDITSEILALAKMSEQAGSIAPELYTQYDVKRGLRDLNGKGVLAGLTNISDVRATKIVNGEAVPAHGQLFLPRLQRGRSRARLQQRQPFRLR